MKTLHLTSALLILLGTFVACSTISDQQVSQIQSITRGVVQSAVTVELSALPKHRPYIEASLKQVSECIAQGKVTATTLGAIVQALPVSPDAIRYTTTGLLVYDGLSFLWLTPASDRALLAMAEGIKAGLQNALAAVPANAKARPGALAAAIAPVPVPPDPRWQDDPKSGLKKNVLPVR